MTWIRLDDGWDEHPKVLAVSEPAAMMWLRAIAVSNRRRTGGFVPLGGLHRLTAHAKPEDLARELATVRAPGCRGGLFDIAIAGEGGAIMQITSHEERAKHEAAGAELVGYFVHDIGDYQPRADGELPGSQGKSDLHQKRSAAGKKGAEARWPKREASDSNGPSSNMAPAIAGGMANDGTLPLANMANATLNASSAMGAGGDSPDLDQATPRARAGDDGKVPMANDGTLLPPDPVPVPMHTHADAGARGATSSASASAGVATPEVWLAAIAPHQAFRVLHGDQKWAGDLGGIAMHRGTRAEDANAAVLAFVEKNAGRVWNNRDELVGAFGGFASHAKQYGDEARSRAARAAEARPPARVNGHSHGRSGPDRGPPPQPHAAAELDLDTGIGGQSR